MKHLAAYLLAVLGGKASPSGADVTKILESVGVTADSAELDRLTAALEGKDLDALIKEGKTKLVSVGSGGGGGGAAPAAASGGAAPAAAKKEEKKEEEEEEDVGGAGGLFGGGDDDW